MKPYWKVTCVNTEETIMAGHMHAHGPLYTRVPFVMFDEGEWVGGRCRGVVVSVVLLLHPSVLVLVRRIALPFQLWLHVSTYIYVYAVSGRKDGNRGARNTLARQQNRTERRSSVFGGRPQCVDEQRKSCSSYRLANVTTLPTASVEVTRTRWHGQHASVVAIKKVQPRPRTAPV